MNNANWWANKLGTTPAPAPRPANEIPMPPSQQPMPQMPAFQQPQAQTKAQSVNQVLTCPDCGSGNYFAIQNAAARCYDCGYPVQQSGSRYGNLAGASTDGSVTGATGNNVQSNWNPQQIIGHID